MKYRVEGGVAHIAAGTKLKLTKDQVSAREHLLEDAGNGSYTSDTIMTFKSGEVLDIVDPFEKLPRALQVVLVPASATKEAGATGKGRRKRAAPKKKAPAGSDAPNTDPATGASPADAGPQPFSGVSAES